MRFVLGGQDDSLSDLADQFVVFRSTGTFHIPSYLAAGYDAYDLYVVAGGGAGGGGGWGRTYPDATSDAEVRGGGGGGGGASGQTIKALGLPLAALPSSTSVRVGPGGVAGAIHSPGANGEFSAFAGYTALGGGGGGYGTNGTPDVEGLGGGGGGDQESHGANGIQGGAPGGSSGIDAAGSGGRGGSYSGVGVNGQMGRQSTLRPELWGGSGGGGGGRGANTTSFALSESLIKGGNGADGIVGFKTFGQNGSKAKDGTSGYFYNSNRGVIRCCRPGQGGGGGGGPNLTALTGVANLLGLAGWYLNVGNLPTAPGAGGHGGGGGYKWMTRSGGGSPDPGTKGASGCVLLRVFKM